METAQIKKFLTKLPRVIAEHAFLACLFLFFLALIFGGLLFYEYNILVKKTKVEILDEVALLKEKAYQEILKTWQEHERRFEEADFKEYPDPFLESVPFPEG